MEFGWLVLEKKILRYFQFIFTVLLLTPLEEGQSPSFEKKKLEYPSPKDDLCQDWLKLAQWFWRSGKCKRLQTDGQTDRWMIHNGQSEKLT
jgi:hypothetical protein